MLLDEAALRVGRSPSTLLRWVRRGLVPTGKRSDRFELSDDHVAAIFDANGQRKLAWERLSKEGKVNCSERTFQRAAERDMTARQAAYAKGGAKAAREHSLFLERQERGRGVCFEADHKQADVFVLPPRSTKPVRPWITIFIDTFSRAIAGLAVSIRPTQDEVLAAFGAAMAPRPDLGPVGCVPEMLRIDRGLEFTANAITDAAVMLGIQVVHTPPYTPNRKGKVERLHLTLVTEFMSQLPHYVDGPRRRDGSLAVPKDLAPLSLEVFVELLLDWVRHYNLDRGHSALGGSTPAEAWKLDTTPVRKPDSRSLRQFLMKRLGERKVATRGVHVHGRWYIAAPLEPLIGRPVEVRGLQHDRRSVEVFRGDSWVCTAYPHDEISAAQKELILARRRAAAQATAIDARRARAHARRRIAPMVEKGASVETTSITRAEAEAEESDDAAELVRRLGLDRQRKKR